jgi:hypothetical protein
MRFLAALVLFVATAGITARSAAQEDFQIWLPLTLTARYTESFGGYYEIQPRLGDDASEVTQLILRTSLDWYFAPGWAASLGYGWTPTISPRYADENRIYQQLRYIGEGKFGQVTSRTRFEQRWIQNTSGTALRLRSLLRGQIPLTDDRAWSAVVSDEVFVNLDSVTDGPQAGFDQNRFFLGVNRVLHPRASIDVGYQLQAIDTTEPGFADRVNHILLIQLSLQT